MASNRNQHFVPRCYLRAFSTDNIKQINLFNIDRGIEIKNVPIKHQCSKDFFYGNNEQLEAKIQEVEQRYASTARKIFNSKPLSKEETQHMLRFFLLQYLRTDAASQRSVTASQKLNKLIGLSSSTFKLEIKEAVQMAMESYTEAMYCLDDLSFVFIKNETDNPFITSDDPAIMINKWAYNNLHIMGAGIGMQTAGIICIIPISPKVCFCAYDGDIYKVANKNNWLTLRDAKDVNAINSLQYCNCFANLYFSTGASQTVTTLHKQNKGYRPQVRHRLTYAVEEKSADGAISYVACSPDKAPTSKTALVHIEFLGVTPPTWPNLFRIRSTACAYTNGSGVGYLRREHIIKTAIPKFQKVKVRGKMKQARKSPPHL